METAGVEDLVICKRPMGYVSWVARGRFRWFRDDLSRENSAHFNEQLEKLNREVFDLESRLEFLAVQKGRLAEDPGDRILAEIQHCKQIKELLAKCPDAGESKRMFFQELIERVNCLQDDVIEVVFSTPKGENGGRDRTRTYDFNDVNVAL